MTGTTIDNRAAVSVLAKDLDDIWALTDRLLDSVPADSWTKRYGPDWTYADVLWHLAYFDRIMLADVLESGAELPEPQRFNLHSMSKINRWNDQEFAKQNPMLAMLTGKIHVKGFSKMPLMQKVFSPSSPDKQLTGSLYGGLGAALARGARLFPVPPLGEGIFFSRGSSACSALSRAERRRAGWLQSRLPTA